MSITNETKQCSKCNETKPIEKFPNRKSSNGKYYRLSVCNHCKWLNIKESRKKNPELRLKLNERTRIYRKNNLERSMMAAAKYRAKQKQLEFNIELEDIIIPEFCPVFNVLLKTGERKLEDNTPTLDRINSSLGYVKGNVAVISNRANLIKNYGTADEHEKIANWIRSKQTQLN